MGMGETASIDERGRITIPSEIRKTIGKKDFKIKLIDKDTIILEAVNNKENIIKQIRKIRLSGDPELVRIDFSTVKDRYGGKHVEAP
jgi:bifunctional DNA-binding transcriptional regulator/antitoxin component of YhaV-PrlF toxin-antitoxin module